MNSRVYRSPAGAVQDWEMVLGFSGSRVLGFSGSQVLGFWFSGSEFSSEAGPVHERGPVECFEPVFERQRPEFAGQLEMRMRFEKGSHDSLVFLRFTRAGRIDNAATGMQQGRGVAEDGPLDRGKALEVGRGAPPSDIRIAADRPQARARGVDEHGVEHGV